MTAPPPFAYPGLDRVFHERARLGIMTSLAGRADGLNFTELKELCGITDGNLNRHLQVLEEAGHVALAKQNPGREGDRQVGRRPQTRIRLTETGRTAFAAYLSQLEKVLTEARAAATIQPKGHPA